MPRPIAGYRATLCFTVGLLACTPVVSAAGEADAHAHMHPGDSAVAQMSLNAGEKWPTDESLRKGMAAIGSAFDADHARIHAGTETDAQYEALAAKIESEVNAIVAQCKLPAAADANLHYVVADLLQGVSLMRGTAKDRSRHDGAALVHGALRAYGKFFDDPAAAADDHMPK